MKIGDYFKKSGWANDIDVQKALAIQKNTGGLLGEILAAEVKLRPLAYYETLANYYNLQFIELINYNPDRDLLNDQEKFHYLRNGYLPLQYSNDRYEVATCQPSEIMIEYLQKIFGPNTKIYVTSKLDIIWILQQYYSEILSHESVYDLIAYEPKLSAKQSFNIWQASFLFLLIGGLAVSAFFWPFSLSLIIHIFFTYAITLILMYRLFLSSIGLTLQTTAYKYELTLQDHELPVYTILVPLFKEKHVTLKYLMQALLDLDYPAHKLDIKLLLEEDDKKTIDIVKNFQLPFQFEYIYVPRSKPQTKPKACNYGLKFAYGKYVTLYDAEDLPEPDQLRQVVETFNNSHEKVVCIQCRLSFYNKYQNWLTKQFSLEYINWFSNLLPALSWMEAPIPLGGNSNHFKRDFLNLAVAWDPFNVTEDADLGVRLNRLGYETRVINSTTYEEANGKLINWFKQRTRWIKGYMQTYLVHMRYPFSLLKSLKLKGFLSFQLFIGGVVATDLMLMPFYLLFIVYQSGVFDLSYLFPPFILPLSWVNFIAGTFIILLTNVFAVIKAKDYSLWLHVITTPIYWLLMSLASYRALYQLLFQSNKWEKTEHGFGEQYIESTHSNFIDRNTENR